MIAAAALLAYEVAAFAVAFAGDVVTELRGRRVQLAADAVDHWLQRRGSSIKRVYLRQLRANVRNMETVGIATQGEYVLRMRQVYVDVSLVPKPLHATAGEPYVGPVVPGEDAAVPGQRRSLESMMRQAERSTGGRALAVVGGPGSGKTTLARNTALGLCEGRWRPRGRRLPVLLYLRDHATALLADDPPSLSTVAVSAGWLEGKVPANWLEHRLDRGRCVVLLDGLDEVAAAKDRARVVDWIKRQIQRHPRTLYVVTSRPHGYQSNPLPEAEVLQVRRFTREQISRFVHQWSYAIERRARDGAESEVRAAARRNAEDLLARLRDRPALYDLAANPLLLTMTANVHRYRGQLPGSRAALYAEMCDVLLHRRSEVRGLSDATGLSGPHKQHVVQHLALAMMEANVRDWPLHEAVEAIRHPLQQVPGNVEGEVFLDEACKSGLLVEREHGVYGFAHLTLQEYLAAAQLGTQHTDITLLTGNVTNPWWRETIRLWAAGNDATAVITACLDASTVSALALAYDCAEQARTVDLTTRERLTALLESPETGQDPARRRLLIGIRATRTLHETIAVSDSAALCARPVPRSLYRQFVHDEQAEGRHHPRSSNLTDTEASATGMHAGDAERFITWLNTITGDSSYRLPTPEELADPAAEMAADLTRHTVWAHSDTRALLHQPAGVPWPYTPSPGQIHSLPAADRQRITRYLRLWAIRPSQRRRVEEWTGVIATAFKTPPELHRGPVITQLDPALDRSFALIRALVSALARDGGVDLTRVRDLTRDLIRVFALDHNLDPARARAQARGHDLALALGIDLDPDPDFPSYPDPDLALAPAPAPALALALNLILDLAPDLAPDLDLAPDPTPHLIPALAHDLDLARALDPALAHALDHEPAVAVADDLDLAHALAHGPVPEPAITLAHDLDLAIALAHDPDLDLDFSPHASALRVAFAALRTLFAVFKGSADAEPPFQLTRLDDLLVRTGTDRLSSERQAPEDPASTLAQVHDLLRGALRGTRQELLPQAQLLVEQTLELLLSVRDRRLPGHPHVLACIRTALLAATAVLCVTDQHPEEAALLHLTWQSLTTHNQPSPNQILLVTRTHQ
ncbi:hypothetical protein AQJ46_48205 [Streptomyces canus]|uniref:NACHT domain-containing protein n=1 Tax=Streptomyces canus TaxID=58343 RepID=A0A101RKN0_9ACTN|nr:NACHT domain-containing protein [Streptomyces canus]KUN57174.1 hypothetical protein AQJ46_48205 [Streptomyces canus]